MNNNTETIEQAASRIFYKNQHKKSTVDSMIELVNWQKEQDEAKIVSLIAEMESWKSENFENLESANKTILDWEAKYKALLDSHEDLLKLVVSCQPLIIRNYGNEEMAKAFETVINKAKKL